MIDLDPAPRILGFLLGLGDLNRTVCHGYVCGCVCLECSERARLAVEPPREPVRFPWEMAA